MQSNGDNQKGDEEEYYKPPSAALTLSQRRDQSSMNQKDPFRNKGKRQAQNEVEAYSRDWVVMKVREELGYDFENPYKNEEDEKELHMKNELEKESEIDERLTKAKQRKQVYD